MKDPFKNAQKKAKEMINEIFKNPGPVSLDTLVHKSDFTLDFFLFPLKEFSTVAHLCTKNMIISINTFHRGPEQKSSRAEQIGIAYILGMCVLFFEEVRENPKIVTSTLEYLLKKGFEPEGKMEKEAFCFAHCLLMRLHIIQKTCLCHPTGKLKKYVTPLNERIFGSCFVYMEERQISLEEMIYSLPTWIN